MLAAGTAGAFNVYFDPAGTPDSGGMTNAALLAAILAASPKALPVPGAVAYTVAQLQAKLQESAPSGALWVYFHSGAASGEGVAASDMAGKVIPEYTEDTIQVITFKAALIYGTASFGGVVEGTVAANTIFTVDQTRTSTPYGSWYKIKGGTYDGEFIRSDEVHIGIIV